MEKIIELKKTMLTMAYQAQEGHIPSAFSITDILWVLYDKVKTENDYVILSKGHACLALYAILADKGLIPKEEINKFCKFNGKLGGHPRRNPEWGITASTGSLGHGLPISVGLALSKKIKGEDGRVFCIIGDGEFCEGSNQEAMLLASQHELSNLVCIVDYNHSLDKSVNVDSIANKFSAYGWGVSNIIGHNHFDLLNYLQDNMSNEWDEPFALVCHNTKGYGCPSIENNPSWHHINKLSKEDYERLLGELYA